MSEPQRVYRLWYVPRGTRIPIIFGAYNCKEYTIRVKKDIERDGQTWACFITCDDDLSKLY